jgi:GT2 family glycosyltransferase
MKTGSLENSTQIAVILLCWNDQSATRDSIAELLHRTDQNMHLWVVDNGSDPPFIPQSGTFSNLHVIRSDINLGFAGGNNLGITQALVEHPSHILLLNTDAHLTASGFNALLSYAQSQPDLDILGPVLQERNQLFYGGQDPALHLNTRLTAKEEVDYIPGTVFLCKTEVFTKIGPLDEEFFFSGEIADYCKRARDAGFKIGIHSDLVVDHEIGMQSSERRDTLYLYYNLRNRFLYISKHYPSRNWVLYIQWIFRDTRMMIGALLEGKLSKAGAIFWAIYDGLFGNFGNRNARFERSKSARDSSDHSHS